jgi:glycosyltransferase involved in cell wall biosynthesis
MVNTKLSIIIPCYNSGDYIKDCLSSISNSGFSNAEIIIIDDGSTDSKTLRLLDSLDKNIKVIKQKNKGPAGARNTGVKNSNGEILLFLDSDNMIKPNYINKALTVFENDKVGVVYGNPDFFGDKVTDLRNFTHGIFNLDKILVGNYIDMCAFVRKKTWEEVGGFDESLLVFGFEDWEFWIRIGQTKWLFYHINEPLFNYRIREGSVSDKVNIISKKEMTNYIVQKHALQIHDRYKYYFRLHSKFRQKPILFLFKLIIKKILNFLNSNVKV